MPVEGTPTRRSSRTPASSKKYGKDFVTDTPKGTVAVKQETQKINQSKSPAASRSKSPVGRRAKSSKEDEVQGNAGEGDATGGRVTRRGSKRQAKPGEAPAEETVVKKSKVVLPPTSSPQKKPAKGKKIVQSGASSTAGEEATPGGDAGATGAAAVESEENIVWQPLATVANPGEASTVPIGNGNTLQAIEVNLAADAAKTLSSKGPVNITPTSEIYKALKKALDTHRTKAMQGKSVGDSIQIALRVLPPLSKKQPVPMAIHKAGTSSSETTPAAKNQASTSKQVNPTKQTSSKSGGTTPAKKSAHGKSIKSEVIVDVIRPNQVRSPATGRLAQSNLMNSSLGGSESPASIFSTSPRKGWSPKQIQETMIVPMGKKRLRTIPSQTLAEDMELCHNVNTRNQPTVHRVITVSADRIGRPKLRPVIGNANNYTTGAHKTDAPVRKGTSKKGCQTKITLSGLELTILEALQVTADDDKEKESAVAPEESAVAPDPFERCSLGYVGSMDGEADRRIQAMLFGHDLDVAMVKQTGRVMSNVMHNPADGQNAPRANVVLESWSLALASASVDVGAAGQEIPALIP